MTKTNVKQKQNKNTTLLAALSLLCMTPQAFAATVAEKCPDIVSCAKATAEITKQKYIFDADVKAKFESAGAIELTPENAEILFTSMLNTAGFSRVPIGTDGVYQIMRQRDAREQAIPVFEATQSQAPNLPNHWDIVMLKYKATYPETVEEVVRATRSFLPASARIIPHAGTGTVWITESAINLKRIYNLFKDMDTPLTPAQKKARNDKRRQAFERRMNVSPEVSLADASKPKEPAH